MSADAESLHPLIRPLNWGDLDRIMEIELAAYPTPWSRGIFGDCIRVGYACWGLQLGLQLIGYSIQTEAAGEAHLLNLCVDAQWRRRGFGALLLDNAIRVAHASGCDSMFLEVRPSNLAAISLYQTRGFVIAGKRFGYYSAGGTSTSQEPKATRRLRLGKTSDVNVARGTARSWDAVESSRFSSKAKAGQRDSSMNEQCARRSIAAREDALVMRLQLSHS